MFTRKTLWLALREVNQTDMTWQVHLYSHVLIHLLSRRSQLKGILALEKPLPVQRLAD